MMQALALQHGLQADLETLASAFEHSLAKPSVVRFAVGQRGGQVVGMASLHEGYSTWRAAPYGRVEDFYVLPEERGSGVGSAILAMLVEEAHRRGYCRLELQVQEENDAAWKFYESRGFRFTGYLVYAREMEEEAP
jgi:ribosomal protein S18 acetylase RimI-like enzyme